ncbi:MAG: ABC transporter permease [Solirubrobacteraceae bacterium]
MSLSDNVVAKTLPARDHKDRAAAALRVGRQLAPYLVLIVLVVYFAASSSVFMTKDNLFNILRASSTLLVIASGATLVVVAGSVDLSVGATAALAGTAVVHWALTGSADVLFLAIPIGIVCGLINGVLVAYAKLPSFLTTLGTLFIFGGLALRITGGTAEQLQNSTLDKLVNQSSIGGIPNITWWAVLVLIAVCVLAYRTPFGRHIYAIGGNERVARLSGLPVARDKLLMFVLSGMVAGIAGLMLAAQASGSSPGMGDSFLLNAIAAIVMGGTALSGGTGGPARTVLGVFTITVLANGMTLTQVDPHYQQMVFGLIVIFAVAMTVRRSELDAVK